MPPVRLSVKRSDTVSKTSRTETHLLDLAEKASVLDALFALQCGPAPDLAFKFSCRVGMCGSCAVVVNGRERLACSTLVKDIGNELLVEPLRNLPVIRDLAVDLRPFFDSYRKVLPHFTPREDLDPHQFYSLPAGSRDEQERQPQCIDCAACYSSCSLVTLNPRYVGPMALHRAFNLITDPRASGREERLRLVGGETGAFRCHTLGNCREVCPRGISPTRSIENLKRLAVFDLFRRMKRRVFGGS